MATLHSAAPEVWIETPSLARVRFVSALQVALIALCAIWAVWSVQTQNSFTSDSPGSFQAARAKQELAGIATTPHPPGTAAHEAVRGKLLASLRESGVQAIVQQREIIGARRGVFHPAGFIRNIVGRIPGTTGQGDVVLVAHYDSVAMSPGGADDGLGIAVLLESARALQAGPRLKNTVVLLFTDCEEEGLLGAESFLRDNPASRIRAVLNFEARGDNGPAVMFETGKGNEAMIRTLARNTPSVIATSLAGELYKRLPNDTDFSVFKRAGLSGMTFAVVARADRYHSKLDSVENLDERSLRQLGESAVSLVRALDDEPAAPGLDPNEIYFNLPPWLLIHYPESWSIPTAALSFLVWIAAAFAALRLHRLRGIQVLAGAVTAIGITAIAASAVWVIVQLLSWMRPALRTFPGASIPHAGLLVAGFLCAGWAVSSQAARAAIRKVPLDAIALGAALLWATLALGSSLLAVGASYALVWPALFLSLGLLIRFVANDSAINNLLAAVCILPAVYLAAQTMSLLYLAFSASAAVILAVPFVLLFLAVIWLMRSPRALQISATGGFAALLVLVSLVVYASGATAEQPQRDTLLYAQNADLNKAVWASVDERPDRWTSLQLSQRPSRGSIGKFLPSSFNGFLFTETSPRAVAPPSVELLTDVNANGTRAVQVRLHSVRKAPVLAAWVDSKTSTLKVSMAGEEFQTGAGEVWAVRYFAPQDDGVVLSLHLQTAAKVRIRLTDQSYELAGAPNRPPTLIAAPYVYTDSTFVSRTFEF